MKFKQSQYLDMYGQMQSLQKKQKKATYFKTTSESFSTGFNSGLQETSCE